MRSLTAIRDLSCSALSAVVISLIAKCGDSSAQQIQFGFAAPPSQIELTAPHVETISGAIAARLDQAHALVVGRNWDEAVDIYRELIVDKSGRLVALDGRRFV